MTKKLFIPERLRRQVRERAQGRCEYCLIHEEGIGKRNQLKVGTAATAVFLED